MQYLHDLNCVGKLVFEWEEKENVYVKFSEKELKRDKAENYGKILRERIED